MKAYIGRKPCGCAIAGVIDNLQIPTITAEIVEEFRMRGLSIEHVDCESIPLKECKCELQYDPLILRLTYTIMALEGLAKAYNKRNHDDMARETHTIADAFRSRLRVLLGSTEL